MLESLRTKIRQMTHFRSSKKHSAFVYLLLLGATSTVIISWSKAQRLYQALLEGISTFWGWFAVNGNVVIDLLTLAATVGGVVYIPLAIARQSRKVERQQEVRAYMNEVIQIVTSHNLSTLVGVQRANISAALNALTRNILTTSDLEPEHRHRVFHFLVELGIVQVQQVTRKMGFFA